MRARLDVEKKLPEILGDWGRNRNNSFKKRKRKHRKRDKRLKVSNHPQALTNYSTQLNFAKKYGRV